MRSSHPVQSRQLASPVLCRLSASHLGLVIAGLLLGTVLFARTELALAQNALPVKRMPPLSTSRLCRAGVLLDNLLTVAAAR